MVAMDDLVRWLGEQLDEDERIARACPGNGEWDADGVLFYARDLGAEVRTHMVKHDPARVLREIEAKRAVVARYEFACREASRVVLAEDERETWIRVGGALQAVVIQLAAPYSGRPGFKAEEWSP